MALFLNISLRAFDAAPFSCFCGSVFTLSFVPANARRSEITDSTDMTMTPVRRTSYFTIDFPVALSVEKQSIESTMTGMLPSAEPTALKTESLDLSFTSRVITVAREP